MPEVDSPWQPIAAAPAAPAAPVDGEMLDDAALKRFSSSDEGKKLAAWVTEEYRKAADLRKSYERRWILNYAFYDGKQYVEWNTTANNGQGGLATVPGTSQWTPRIVVNRIQPIIRTEQSKMLGQKPTATVMPESNDDKDIFAAQAGEQVWESLYTRLDFQAKLADVCFWLSIAGTSFMKTCWDESAWDSASKVYGDLNWIPLSPYQVLVPDLLERDIEKQPWVMDVQAKPVSWINENYGEYFPKGVKAAVNRVDEIMPSKAVGSSSNEDKPDSAVIMEIWIKPGMTKILPKGGMATVIDGVVVQAAINGMPYSHKEYPFAKFEHIPTGKFYASSIIEPLIPLQREYNRTQSQIIEAKNRMAKPQVYFREGSMTPSQITSEPGLYIPIKGSAEFPQPVPLTELPSYVVQFNERQEVDFENISGQHASTKGDAPASMAATSIAYLQEQDDQFLTTTHQSIERGIQKVARQSLVLASVYWTVPRLVKATGEDGGLDAILMKGEQLNGSTDIRIEAGSSLATSKSARQAQVGEWMKFGWIDPNEGFELLDMPMLSQWVNRRKVDKKAAQYENIDFRALDEESVIQFQQEAVFRKKEELQQELAQKQQGIMDSPDVDPMTGAPVDPALAGQAADIASQPANPLPQPDPVGAMKSPSPIATECIIPVNSWDDHAVHIEVHDLWRKSPSYRFVSDAVKVEVEKHVQLHRAALAGKLQEEAMLASMAAPPADVSVRGPHGGGASVDAQPPVDAAQTSPFQGSTQDQLEPPQ